MLVLSSSSAWRALNEEEIYPYHSHRVQALETNEICLNIWHFGQLPFWKSLSIYPTSSLFICIYCLIHEMHVCELRSGVTMHSDHTLCGKRWLQSEKRFHLWISTATSTTSTQHFHTHISIQNFLISVRSTCLYLFFFQIFLKHPAYHKDIWMDWHRFTTNLQLQSRIIISTNLTSQ